MFSSHKIASVPDSQRMSEQFGRTWSERFVAAVIERKAHSTALVFADFCLWPGSLLAIFSSNLSPDPHFQYVHSNVNKLSKLSMSPNLVAMSPLNSALLSRTSYLLPVLLLIASQDKRVGHLDPHSSSA